MKSEKPTVKIHEIIPTKKLIIIKWKILSANNKLIWKNKDNIDITFVNSNQLYLSGNRQTNKAPYINSTKIIDVNNTLYLSRS